MLKILTEKRKYRKCKIMFCQEKPLVKEKIDVIQMFYCDSFPRIRNCFWIKVYSAVNDLLLEESEIMKGFTKTVRYEISRAEKEKITIGIINSSEILDSTIQEKLRNAYNCFCDEKGYESIKKNFDIDELQIVARENSATVTYAEYEGGITYHVYFHDDNTVMLMYSFSCSNLSSEVDRNLAGRANRLLHWKDMLLFKSLGKTVYDWGGLFDPKGENGIDKFKLSFGSSPREAYVALYGNTRWGKILVWGYRLKHRSKK